MASDLKILQLGCGSMGSRRLPFLPVVKALVEMVPSALGPLLGYQFFLAGDMARWHPTEGLEYYGRHRDTAPAREMGPFELSWLARVFGHAKKVAGSFNRFSQREGAFEDTWSLLMELEHGGTGQLTVTMACPHNLLWPRSLPPKRVRGRTAGRRSSQNRNPSASCRVVTFSPARIDRRTAPRLARPNPIARENRDGTKLS